MKTCSVCEREISSQMVRHGAALSRGGDLVHRECHRMFEQNRPGARPPSAQPVYSPEGDLGLSPGQPIEITVEYASFWRRLGAHLLDGLILNVLVILVAFPLGLGAALRGGTAPQMASMVGWLVGIIVPVAYCVGYWTRKGATPGKLALGIRVVNADDGAPTGAQSLVRYLGYILSSIPLCLGYAWMLWDREKRCWHDILSGTRVIRA